MAAPSRTPFQIEHDREEITRRYLRRETQQEIAAALGMTRELVKYDLGVIQERWRKDTARNLDDDKARELARIDELERTYWHAWERSRQDKVSISEETEPPDPAQVALAECRPDSLADAPRVTTKITTRREGQVGNPAYLTGVQWCIDRRCKLLGLDAPAKHEIAGKDGGPIDTTDTRVELARRLAELAARAGPAEPSGDADTGAG